MAPSQHAGRRRLGSVAPTHCHQRRISGGRAERRLDLIRIHQHEIGGHACLFEGIPQPREHVGPAAAGSLVDEHRDARNLPQGISLNLRPG